MYGGDIHVHKVATKCATTQHKFVWSISPQCTTWRFTKFSFVSQNISKHWQTTVILCGSTCRSYAAHLQMTQMCPTTLQEETFDVITSIVSFLWAYSTAARDVTGERVRTAYDVTAACYLKRRTQRNVFCHT
jgi:hypothetical protein